MKYQLLFLPVEGIIEDGCLLMDADGKVFQYNYADHFNLNLENFRLCEPFFVYYEFNRMHIAGRPSPLVDWVKAGDWVKTADCIEQYCNPTLPRGIVKFYDTMPSDSLAVSPVIRVKCPTCGHLH
jgi:hypothetical protein